MGRKAKGPQLGSTIPRVRLAATMTNTGIIAPILMTSGWAFLFEVIVLCRKGDASMPSPRLIEPVLIADDDTDDCLITMEAWEETGLGNELRFVQDGDALIDYLYHRKQFANYETSPRPGLILLDLSMPKKNGMEVLEEIKSDQALKDIPVIVLSTSQAPREASEAYAQGAYGFVTKPSTFHEYLQVMRDVRQAWLEMKHPSTATTSAN